MVVRRRTAERPAPFAGARPNPAPPPTPEAELQGPQGYRAPRPPLRIPTIEERVAQLERDLEQLRADFAAAVRAVNEAFGGSG